MFWHGFLWGVLALACVELGSSLALVFVLNHYANKRETMRKAIDRVEAGRYFGPNWDYLDKEELEKTRHTHVAL